MSRIKPWEAFSRDQISRQLSGNSLCAIMILLFYLDHISKHLRPCAKCKNMYSAKNVYVYGNYLLNYLFKLVYINNGDFVRLYEYY